ncbi:MAG: PadR family transcriptional regulator [Methanobrevibacter sp.]|uniref:PadR family transcriptional regulator n=1 Tax=Methanobrevibacter sp. TaxID=66852 RepID=UPI0026DEEEC8|nr:PadR family transcriptional regulator [Methanobrevibacter sp.]MDO5849555.1 PadR family transcriptional regulator [Methanobrevibacter sp.]
MEGNDLKDCNDAVFVKQFHNGVTRILIMWIISKGKIHGYGISKELDNFFSIFKKSNDNKSSHFNPAKIYPILKNMEDKGLLESEGGVINNKKVKLYSLTDKGQESLEMIRKGWASLLNDDLWIEFFRDMTGFNK